MIIDYKGDIFNSGVNGIIHQANLHHTFGSGIAAQVKVKFPDAYQADLATKEGDYHKLGTFSHAYQHKIDIFNIYSQIGFRTVGNQCATHYPSVFAGMTAVRKYIDDTSIDYRLGIPYKYGCGLAGGDFIIVEKIIRDVFKDWKNQVLICRRPED